MKIYFKAGANWKKWYHNGFVCISSEDEERSIQKCKSQTKKEKKHKSLAQI